MNAYLAMAILTLAVLALLVLSQHGVGGAVRWLGIRLIILGEKCVDLAAAFDAAWKHGAEVFRTYQRRRMGEEA